MTAAHAFAPHLDTLPAAQRALWPQLAPARALGFVLYGGTAIALRLGHRASVDFDFFCERPLDHRALHAALPFMRDAQTLQEKPDTLTVLASPSAGADVVKVSFFGGIDCGRVGTPDATPQGIAEVASLSDLLATKLKVIMQRVEAKDYVDIAAMLAAGKPLPRGLAAAKALFGRQFQPSECLKALTWFEGGDLDSLPAATRAALIEAAAAVRELPSVATVSRQLAAG